MCKIKIIFFYFLKLLIILAGVSFITFFMMSIAPGDPVEEIFLSHHDTPSPEKINLLRKELGLDNPLPVRYFIWLGNVLKLNFGHSYLTGTPVIQEILSRLPTTITLALLSFLFIIFFCILGGTISAILKDKLPDKIHRFLAVILISIPDYLLGLILIMIFSVSLGLLPIKGDGLVAFILPVVTLGLSVSAMEGRILRAVIIDILSQDYIRFAYLKGLSHFNVFFSHVLKASILPMLALWGILFGHLLGGAVIIESVFSLPGLGTYLVESVLRRDIPSIQGIVFFISGMFIIFNQSINIFYHYLDPNINSTKNL